MQRYIIDGVNVWVRKDDGFGDVPVKRALRAYHEATGKRPTDIRHG